MHDVRNLKIEALHERQDLDRLVGLYEDFQGYIEKLARAIQGTMPEGELIAANETVRLRFRDEEHRFLEWSEGEQILNTAIFTLIEEPDAFARDLQGFQNYLLLATKKFEHLIRKKERRLKELHEEISLLTNEKEAREITWVEKPNGDESLPEKVKAADEVAEIGLKWAGRLVQFVPWARTVLKLLGIG